MSAFVQSAQRVLTAAGHYSGPISGQIGPLTRAAAQSAVGSRSFATDWSLVVAATQAALNALGHDAGPVDGILGDRTRAGLRSFELGSVPAPAPAPATSGGLVRIVWHWTAGSHRASDVDRRAYHFIVQGDGTVVNGNHAPEANIRPQRGRHAPHTLNLNTGSIGVSVAAMAGARERPFDPGRFPITQAQVDELVRLTARLCRQYGIPVSRRTTLSHAEVQPTLGVTQRGKWDFVWLPGIGGPMNPVTLGDKLRERVQAELESA